MATPPITEHDIIRMLESGRDAIERCREEELREAERQYQERYNAAMLMVRVVEDARAGCIEAINNKYAPKDVCVEAGFRALEHIKESMNASDGTKWQCKEHEALRQGMLRLLRERTANCATICREVEKNLYESAPSFEAYCYGMQLKICLEELRDVEVMSNQNR